MRENHPAGEPGKQLGKGMWIAAWIVGLALLTLFFGKQEERWVNPNRNPVTGTSPEGYQEVQLKRNRQGHYVTMGQINGQNAQFLLDTGATDVAISSALAQKFGLARGARGLATTANGTVPIFATRIARLQIGDITLYDVPASINPAMDDFILLGMSALQRVEFTQKGKILTLRYLPSS